MAQSSFALMTNLGRAKEAAALANATTIEVTHVAIGDGATVPSGGETALYNEIARKTISGHGTVAGAENVAYFDCYLTAGEGPYTIREAGLYDDDGDLIAIAHYDPPINKPIPASGQTVEGTVRLEVAFSDVANVTIKVDPSMQVALQRLTRLPWIPVISMSLATPPASPAVGDTYVVAAEATGAWAEQSGKVAEYTIAGWAIISPPDGHGVSLPDGRVFERISGSYVEKIALDAQSGKWLYAAAGGNANALTATLVPAPVAYTDGLTVRIKIGTTNTDAVTINLNGLGVKPVIRADGTAIQKNDFRAGAIVIMTYSADADAFLCQPSLRSDILLAALSPATLVKFTTPGSANWTVPDGVFSIVVEAWGGGGGAGYSINGGAPSGGASGAYARRGFSVVPGQVVSIVVGAGGAGASGTSAPDGSAGLATTVTVDGNTMTAGGGGRGLAATTSTHVASANRGGSYSNADFGIDGGYGSIGTYASSVMFGGYGAAAPMGGGQAPGGQGTNLDGNPPGGGGGASSNGTFSGKAGARGEVQIRYIAP